ncbi:MAG TPA: BTAD domain-containing putative transcriptional regulator [Actinoplanes sp.]|nr:BTAD domain-containing putative transcriptional regulator [Actinoplanes sp.]
MTAEGGGLRIRLLGPVHAERGDVELALGSAYRQAVLAALAINPNRALSREELVNAVWGENPPASAMGNIYTYVSTLRRVLEPSRDRWAVGQVLTSGGGSYRLHVDEHDVDACRFEALRDESRKLRAAGDTAAELSAVRAALDLWRGEALAGIPGPYAESQRLRLAELHLATIERHAELMLELGREDEVRAELIDLVARHPRRENLHGLAMTALARGGRVADAMVLYAELRDRLIEETGTEPGAALRQVHAGLVADNLEPARPQPMPDPSLPDPAAPRRPGFVGRDDELTRIRTALAEVAAGRGGSIWIDGEPGSGKSALIGEGLREAGRLGCRVGWGVGDELAQRMPLSVLFECFDLTGDAIEAGGTTRGLIGTLRTAAEIVANPTTAVLETAQSLVRAICAEGPLILVIDDLQWADEASLLVWHSLHRLIDRLPLLLVATCRPLPTNRELHLLRSVLPVSGAQFLELAPLSDQESRELVTALRPEPLPPQRVEELVTAAAGNPFYLHQLVAAADDEVPGGVPASLVAAVHEHLMILSDETRHVLRAIAFLDDECGVTDLPAVTGKPVPGLVRAVESALTSGLLVENGLRLELRHPVVRRVLHDATPTALRVMVHREFAEKIAAADGKLERVVGQLVAGPVPADAWVTAWLAEHIGQICGQLPEQAVVLLRHATAQPGLDPFVRELFTANLARVLFRQGLAAEVEAGWVAARTEHADLRAEMRWMIAVVHHRRGEDAAALDVVRASLRGEGVPRPWSDRYRVLISHLNPTVAATSGGRAGPPGRPDGQHLAQSGEFSVIH